ncbi:MAG: flavin reductase family protein [Bacteroidota bacterium]|nr:flavin reductase family protein [Bacteroidota bacterium]
MLESFTEISPELINDNTIKLIGSDWMLVTAGNKEEFNMMTAAWGGLGFLWKRPVAFIFVRPQRYTFRFTEKNQYFSLGFFTEKYREVLNYCGSHSGRDVDKALECNLTVLEEEKGTVYFEESRLVLVCRKIYQDDISPGNFVDQELEKIYPKKDYHRMYIGEIEKCLVKG